MALAPVDYADIHPREPTSHSASDHPPSPSRRCRFFTYVSSSCALCHVQTRTRTGTFPYAYAPFRIAAPLPLFQQQGREPEFSNLVSGILAWSSKALDQLPFPVPPAVNLPRESRGGIGAETTSAGRRGRGRLSRRWGCCPSVVVSRSIPSFVGFCPYSAILFFLLGNVVLGPHLINFPFSPSRRSLESYWLYMQ